MDLRFLFPTAQKPCYNLPMLQVNKEQLLQMDGVILAVMCKKLWQNPETEPAIAGKAQGMLQEWIDLTERKMPVDAKVADYDKRAADLVNLKDRMAGFLWPHVK